MIYGIGVDVLDIGRMENKLDNERFMARVFTESERSYIAAKGVNSAASAAGIFCAKEAFVKAVGEGLRLPLVEIEVCHNETGQPFFRLSGFVAAKYGAMAVHLSISHTATIVTAFAVVENVGVRSEAANENI